VLVTMTESLKPLKPRISEQKVTGPFCVNSQEVVRAPSPIFLKFYSNCHYPIWWTSANFEWNLSRDGM